MCLAAVVCVLVAVSAAARGGVVPVAAPAAAVVAAAPALVRADYADAYPQYQFAYTVQDSLTGDSKAQEESRDGGIVRGSYSLIEPDGARRTVAYYADPLNGFNAVVQRDLPVAVPAKVVAAAPAKIIAAAPAPARILAAAPAPARILAAAPAPIFAPAPARIIAV